ncbi:MAG: hypothetical protein Q9214_006448 [Letrouitia sp. 1 TL-2023]
MTLEIAERDLLALLGCCFAGAAAQGEVSGTKGPLAACRREVETESVTPRSYTRSLIEKFRIFGNDPFIVIDLYGHLIKDQHELANAPQYYNSSSSRRGRPSITLKRLLSSNVPDSIPGSDPPSPTEYFGTQPESSEYSVAIHILLALSIE